MIHIIPEKRISVQDIAPEVAALCAAAKIDIMVFKALDRGEWRLRISAPEIYSLDEEECKLPEFKAYIDSECDREQQYDGSFNWNWSSYDDDEADSFLTAYIAAQRALYPHCKIIR